jgi:hypothetical protein
MRNALDLLAVSFAACSLASTSLAEVWVVGTGPGADFPEIQQAVDAAADGDGIFIRAGAYAPFRIVDKSLWIAAESPHAAVINGQVHVANLAATRSVVIVGIDAQGRNGELGFPLSSGLNLFNNAGSVRLERCAFLGAPGSGGQGWSGGRIDGSSNVTFVACSFTGGDAPPNATAPLNPPCGCDCTLGLDGGEGLECSGSEVVLYDTVLQGGRGSSGDLTGGKGGNGCSLSASTLFASGSMFQGGVGGKNYDCICLVQGGPGGRGLLVPGDSVARGIDNVFLGGAGGPGPCPTLPGPPGQPVSGTFQVLQGLKRLFQVPSPSKEGTTVDVTLSGVSSDRVYLAGSTSPWFVSFESFKGYLLIDPFGSSIALFDLGLLPPTGLMTVPFSLPALPPSVEGTTYYLQGLFVNASLEVFLGSPSHLVLVDGGL